MGLVQVWEFSFVLYGLQIVQVLLIYDDFFDCKCYLNVCSILWILVELGVVLVINENDMVVIDEICFGDNDILVVLVVNLVEVDLLVIFIDCDGMFDVDLCNNFDV